MSWQTSIKLTLALGALVVLVLSAFVPRAGAQTISDYTINYTVSPTTLIYQQPFEASVQVKSHSQIDTRAIVTFYLDYRVSVVSAPADCKLESEPFAIGQHLVCRRKVKSQQVENFTAVLKPNGKGDGTFIQQIQVDAYEGVTGRWAWLKVSKEWRAYLPWVGNQ